MAQCLYLVIFCLLFVACSSTSEKQPKLSKEQKEYAEVISETPTIIEAHWSDPLTLEVTMDVNSWIGSTNEDIANETASIYAHKGRTITKKDICVKVLNSDKEELAYRCVLAEKL